MARRIIWSERSISDLEAIVEYIAADSPAYASSVARRIFEVALKIKDFPSMGRRVPEFDQDDLREVQSTGYRIIYRVEANRVVIAAIIHGRRSLD